MTADFSITHLGTPCTSLTDWLW